MSGVLAPHLQRREGVYYLRVRVPDVIRPLVGKTEIVRSMRTGLLREARLRAALLTALVLETFDMIKTTEMTNAEARSLIQQCFANVIAEQERRGGFVPQTTEPEMEILEERGFSEDRIADLNEQISLNRFDGDVRQRVNELIQRRGFPPDRISEPRFADLASGMARVLIEEQRHFQLRLEDRLARFTPSDPLFQEADVPVMSLDQGFSPTAKQIKGPTVGQAVERYLKAHEKVWKSRTHKARVWQLGYFVEHVGAARPIASINPDDIRDYRDAVITLRANHGYAPSQTFAEKQTDNVQARIKPKTAELIYQPVQTFFKWAVSTDGLIGVSPARDIKMIVAKVETEEPSRRPFERDEIITLFSSPLFTGCKSVHRRHNPGDKIIRDGKYWIPILGYYTGCRLAELVQLAIEDVRMEGEIIYLDINQRELEGPEEKSVKSKAGRRKVPLHPDLIALGFMDFFAKRAKQDKPKVRLFSDIKFGVHGQPSHEFSKFFARLMDIVGLTDPDLVFHSWRHGAEDAFRNANVQPYVTDRIIGHADNTMAGKYGKGVSLEVMADAVAVMKLPVRLPELLLKTTP